MEARHLVARRGGGPDGGAGEPTPRESRQTRRSPHPARHKGMHECRRTSPPRRVSVFSGIASQVAKPGCRWCGSGVDYSDGGCFQLPILCTERPGSNGAARTAKCGPTRAAVDPPPSTSALLPLAVVLQTAERRSFRCVRRPQTSDLGGLSATHHRQTLAHGPQRPEHGPKTSDTSDLRSPSLALKHSTLTR